MVAVVVVCERLAGLPCGISDSTIAWQELRNFSSACMCVSRDTFAENGLDCLVSIRCYVVTL